MRADYQPLLDSSPINLLRSLMVLLHMCARARACPRDDNFGGAEGTRAFVAHAKAATAWPNIWVMPAWCVALS